MDSKASSVTNGHRSPEIILAEIAQTRRSLTSKIHTLEGRVMTTVEDASSTVQSGINSVKEKFDIHHQIAKHPWYWIGGAFVFGMLLGSGGEYEEGIKKGLHDIKSAAFAKATDSAFEIITRLLASRF